MLKGKGRMACLLVFVGILLVGCGRTFDGEVINVAREAIVAGDYKQGSLVLVLGCDNLHAQSVHLLHMQNYEARDDLMGMVHAWIALGNIDSDEEFIKEEAYRFLNVTLSNATLLEN